MSNKTIAVIGLGYIGLPMAAMLADKGYKVNGIDVNSQVVSNLRNREYNYIEPGLNHLLDKVITNNSLSIHNDVVGSDIFIIAVPTPILDNKDPDLSYVDNVFSRLANVVNDGDLIVLESTSPVGTTEAMYEKHIKPTSKNVLVAYSPERVIPGKVLAELKSNPRVVGGMTAEATKQAAELYRSIVETSVVETNVRAAEMCKLTENSFRDVNIAFANELSVICEDYGINVHELISLANLHPRVDILTPGVGVGGHCISVDPWFIVSSCGDKAKIIKCAREINDSKPKFVIDKIKEVAKEYDKPKIACLGLTFKPDIEDTRESPALEVVNKLNNDDNISLYISEPNVDDVSVKQLIEGLSDNVNITDFENAVAESDIIALLVPHKEFLKLDKTKLAGKTIIDPNGVL